MTAAEHALREGRIDEAYATAVQPDVRRDPRGQRLADALVKPLLARARLHRQAGRYREALADLDRLVALDRLSPEAAELRQQVSAAMQADACRHAIRQATYQEAAEQLRAGALESARAQLDRLSDAERREELAGELNRRVQRGAQLLSQATVALERGDVLSAARYWYEAVQRHGRTRQTDDFAARLAQVYCKSAEGWLEQGRLDQVLAAREQIEALAATQPTVGRFTLLAGLCARAAQQLATRDYGDLRETLLRVKGMCPSSDWVAAAVQALDQIARGQEALLAGPLGAVVSVTPWSIAMETVDAGATSADPPAATLRLDQCQPLLLIVDGGESSLLVTAAQVRIGRQGAADVQVPIPVELWSHHADVVRVGGDYFLTAYGPVEVNKQGVQRRLLCDGDRVKLGERGKFVFSKPSAKSESAVLRLSHRCRLAQDVSSVVLFRDTCLIGRGPACHVLARESETQAVLFERRGALYVRTLGPGESAVRPVLVGEVLELGDLRVTVKPYVVALAESGA